jgi:hypothetical protein
MVACGAQSEPGVVLHQTHGFSTKAQLDTLRTYITATRVRIEHKDGDAILDLAQGRLVLLDGHQKTWRQMPLAEWEAAIRAAATMNRDDASDAPYGDAAAPTDDASMPTAPKFERVGVAAERAGYPCDRWSLYTKRELLPGEIDWVEQQIWVARELSMPPGAYEAYDRAIRAIDSIGMGALVQRPEGVVLVSEIRVGSAAEHEKGSVEVETLSVYRVEARQLDESVFDIPPTYKPAPRPEDNEEDF